MKGTSLLVLFFVQVQENIEQTFSLAQKLEETKNTEIHTYMKNVIEKKKSALITFNIPALLLR